MRLAQIFILLPDPATPEEKAAVHAGGEEGWYADYVSEWLRNAEHDGIIVDWGYVHDKNMTATDGMRYPTKVPVGRRDRYQEGDFYATKLAKAWEGPTE